MFYVLSKLLPLLIYPLGLTCVLLLGAALALKWRQRWAPGLIGAALLVLLVGGNRLASAALVRSLEGRYPALDATAGLPTADAIVVLGGGTRSGMPPRPSHEVGEAGDRVLYGARLYRAGVAPYVVVSGGNAPLVAPDEIPEAEAMAELLAFAGVPEAAIIREPRSRNTYENAVETARLLQARDMARVVLVTSAMHMPRAAGVFEQTGLEIIPAPTDYLVSDVQWADFKRPALLPQVMNLLPNAEHLEMMQKAMKEYAGYLVYRLRGWL